MTYIAKPRLHHPTLETNKVRNHHGHTVDTVDVLYERRQVGRLSTQMSEQFIPIIDHAFQNERLTAVWGTIRGSAFEVSMTIQAARPEEIVLGPSTTQLMRNLCAAMASQFKPGDEVIVTDFDHESNIGPWMPLKERGVVIRTWSLDPETCEIDLGEL